MIEFLGLYLDQRLRFKECIEYEDKKLKRLNLLKCFQILTGEQIGKLS